MDSEQLQNLMEPNIMANLNRVKCMGMVLILWKMNLYMMAKCRMI